MIELKKYIIVLAGAVVCFGCSKSAQPDNPLLGTEISFETSVVSLEEASDLNSPDTKLDMKFYNSSYNWEEGDKIKLVSHSTVSDNVQTAEYSYSSYKWKSAAPLRWEEGGAHDFYAVYPATAAVSFDDPVSTYSDKAALIGVEILKTQTNTNLGRTYSMAGTYHVDDPMDRMTFEMFPLVTVLRFVFNNHTGTSLRVVPTQLVGWDGPAGSSVQLNLYGKYQVKTEAAEESRNYAWNGNTLKSSLVGFTETPPYKSVSISASSTINNNGTWGFQVYVVPHDNYMRFVLTVNLTKGSGAMQTKQITYTNYGNVFEPFQLHILNVEVR